MATAVFPAYGLARLVVRPAWALFAAAGTGLAPALAYAPILVNEPTAYPASTLALYLVARWMTMPRTAGFLLALAACGLGFLTRTQLAILVVVLGAAALAVGWRTPAHVGVAGGGGPPATGSARRSSPSGLPSSSGVFWPTARRAGTSPPRSTRTGCSSTGSGRRER